jgi:hypothetical protein
MTTIANLVSEYVARRETGGLYLEQSEILQCFIDAVRQYAAYGYLRDPAVKWVDTDDSLSNITAATTITASEWGVIRHLAELYTEKESAMRLEATRGLGADVYGRSVAEVASDITQYEAELPQLAFFEPCFGIGMIY